MQQGLRTSGAGSKKHYVAADQIAFTILSECLLPLELPRHIAVAANFRNPILSTYAKVKHDLVHIVVFSH